MIALYDYGAGNIHSLAKGLEAGGARVRITDQWNEALDADALVLPGVGAFGAVSLDNRRVREALEAELPCLGICLGMQLLLSESEEASGEGIGRIPGVVRRLQAKTIPQMGWNDVEAGDDPLLEGLGTFSAYYANSFVCQVEDPEVVVASTTYERDRFPAVIRRGWTWGVQFHPEKSSEAGLRLLANFIRIVEER
jgi:imidazole glycerol-phosphate synthase subunit HisH